MYLTIDENDKRPLYQQVVDGLKSLMARGELREGMSLPPVRQVAGDLGVNLNTIATAYRQLQEEGLLSVRHGSGAMVLSPRERTPPTDGLFRALHTALTNLILAGLNDAEIVAAVRQELNMIRKKGEPR